MPIDTSTEEMKARPRVPFTNKPVLFLDELNEMFRENNPSNEPTGPHTGRCGDCGSKNLWDDMMTYGCNDCGRIYWDGF